MGKKGAANAKGAISAKAKASRRVISNSAALRGTAAAAANGHNGRKKKQAGRSNGGNMKQASRSNGGSKKNSTSALGDGSRSEQSARNKREVGTQGKMSDGKSHALATPREREDVCTRARMRLTSMGGARWVPVAITAMEGKKQEQDFSRPGILIRFVVPMDIQGHLPPFQSFDFECVL